MNQGIQYIYIENNLKEWLLIQPNIPSNKNRTKLVADAGYS